jgi:PAS domain S-box-containing protein
LLIRQEGNDVLYLNELRHRTGTALTLRLPIVDKNLPAARAVRGETGEMAGVDYRGVPVLAHVRAVPGTKWFMVAKVDAAEINAPLRQQTLLIGVSLGLLLLVIGLGAGLFWRQQRVRHYREKEDAVRASEVRYRRLFEAARDGVLILDAETGMVVDVNPYLIELLGVTREVFLGKKVWELGFFKDIVANEANFYEDMAMEGHDGKRHEVEFVSNVYLVNHQKVIQCNIRDISERVRVAAALRESEDNYRLLFREMQNGFALHEIICDEAGNPSDYRFLAVNPAFERMTGLKAAETVGRTVLEILPDTERSWIEHYGKVALTGVPVCFENYAASMKKHFEVVAFRPTINQFACVFSDITERKQAEAMVQRVAQELQHKNAELERFLYTASHDLKSPVVTVRTFLGYLEQDMPTGDAGRIAKDMEFIRAATDKIAQLLDDVLEMSRIGRVVVPPVTVTLRALVDDALGAVAGRIAERGVTMQVNDGDAALHGDRVRLAEVFQNLLDNACKFMGDQKEPRIEVGTMRNAECGLQIAEFGKVAENGSSQSAIRNPKSEIATSEIAMSEILNPTSEIVFFVRDNGIGIDPRHQAKVFDLFEKLDPKAEGTGIGLALVKRIVGLHGGRVWVESAGFGQGTCFYFTLPGTRGGTEGRDQKSEVGGDTP